MRGAKIIFRVLFTFIILSVACSTRKSGEAENQKPHYYSEQFRPLFHFSPDSMWMNDPNGMAYYKGEYHLFYQYNPYSNVWGPMHWGHAITTDLIHWDHLPVALYPDSLGTIFSGSAVIDWNNSSGLGTTEDPPMVAIFTQNNQALAESGSNRFQYQSMAYSLDRGRNWTKYYGNPVLENPGIRDFRDPKVIWMEDVSKWIMVLAAHDRVMFFSSPDLINWNMESEFGANTGAHGGVWECPDLFPLEAGGEEKWVLLVSINPGGPNGGSATQYFVGEFNGKHYQNENPGPDPLWLDQGKDDYAGVTWSDIPPEDGRRLFLGWMSNWQYATQVPTERWRSAMTLPRELRLAQKGKGYILTSVPVHETEMLRAEKHILKPGPVEGRDTESFLRDGENPLYEIDLTFVFDPDNEEDVEFGIKLESDRQEQLVVAYNHIAGRLSIDRNGSGKTDFSKDFAGIQTAPYRASGEGEIRFHAFIDMSSIELFVDQGALIMTELCFPESGYDQIILYSTGPSVNLKQGTIYSLKSTW
jgi:fructan beta-fructosidase